MKTIPQKKAFFVDGKHFWPFFSRITEYGRPQVTTFWAPEGISEIIVQVIRSFL